jgi:DNA-binding transcriptional ArsR family regulator
VNQINEGKQILKAIGPELTKIASVLSLAGNETRLKTLLLLYKEHQLCVCDLGDILEMQTPAISQHLRKLKDGGLIYAKKKGQTIFYKLREEVKPVLKPIFEQLENKSEMKEQGV